MRLVFAMALGLVASACGGGESPADDGSGGSGNLPPRVCKTPGSPAATWFEDASADFGLAKTSTLEPLGNAIIGADLDNDTMSDLLVFNGGSDREPADGKRARFLFLNRPSPSDANARVLVDQPDLGGLLATRDGQSQRGMSLALVGDLDNDGSTDVITCPSDFDAVVPPILDPCVAFLNDGTAHFSMAATDIDPEHPATSGVLVDFDRDGILDLFLPGIARWPNPSKTSWSYGPRLLKGKGDGTFEDISASVGLPLTEGFILDSTSWRSSLGATSCDLDDDGDQDFILTAYGRQPNQVYLSDGGQLVEAGGPLGLDHDDRMDFSDDQSYRCYCQATASCSPAPPPPDVSCTTFGNPYFRGWSPGISDQPENLGGNNMGVTCGDIDDDGDMDVTFATIVHGDVGSASDPSELILNPGNGGKFTRPGNDVTGLLRPPLELYDNHGDHMVVYEDIDLDGRKDVWMASIVYPGTHQWLWQQKSDGTFEEVSTASGLHKSGDVPVLGATLVDLDGDGDLELVTGRYTDDRSVHAYRNLAGQEQNFIRVKLVGKGAGFSNAAGIGARVQVTAGGRTQTREVRGGQGLGNIQNDLILTFGLGDACDVDRIEVRWPDANGTLTTHDDVRANYTVVIHEGESTPEYL